MKFELKKEHLALMRMMIVEWNEGAYSGAPAINEKRPYGNGDVYMDIAEILCWEIEQYEGIKYLNEDQITDAKKIHMEMGTALQIVLCIQSFEPGIYEQKFSYSDLSWQKV